MEKLCYSINRKNRSISLQLNRPRSPTKKNRKEFLHVWSMNFQTLHAQPEANFLSFQAVYQEELATQSDTFTDQTFYTHLRFFSISLSIFNYRSNGIVDYTVSVGVSSPPPTDGTSPISILIFSVGSVENTCRSKGKREISLPFPVN